MMEAQSQDADDEHAVDNESTHGSPMNSRRALPREHSYLEESHPLLPDADLHKLHSVGNGKRGAITHELAILELHGVVLFPDCTIPVKLRNRSMIKYLGKQINKCRSDPVNQPRVLIGILPYERSQQSERRARPQEQALRNRRSWMRQRFSFGNGDIAPTASSRRLRQSLTMLRDEFPMNDSDDADEHQGFRRNLNMLREQFGNSDSENNSNTSDSDSDDDNDNDYMQYPRFSTERRRSLPTAPSHPLVGRIGTIAVVQQTHERRRRRHHEDAAYNSRYSTTHHWDNYEQAPELVFTAVGTSRFRIISCVNDEQNIFKVEELQEASLQRPPMSSKLLLRTNSNNLPSPAERMAWNLSLVTPLPFSVYKHKLPWSIVEKIAKQLETNNGRGNLPSLGDESIVTNRSKLEPRAFSYWMANNAPFSEGERLKLLKMDSVLERLLYIHKKVEKLLKTRSKICCNLCKTPLADVSDIFVVGGAEGTTSNYVNGHGFIHQITTLRDIVSDNKVSFQDVPSTENTYFPGYSWWITCCSYCGSMLGWKFQKVRNGDDSDDGDGTKQQCADDDDKDTPERPAYFYGFMASNVNVAVNGRTSRTERNSDDSFRAW